MRGFAGLGAGVLAGFRTQPAWLMAVALIQSVALIAAAGTAAAAEKRALCVHDVPAGQALRVRSGPGYSAVVIGEFRSGACGVRLIGRCDGDWCEMALGGNSGWVNTRYIGIYELPGSTAAAVQPDTERRAEIKRTPSFSQPAPTPVSPPPPVVAQKTTRHGQAYKASPVWGRVIEQGSSEPAPGACVARVERWDTLRIRSGPGVGHDEIGDIPPGACRVERVGGCRGDWCRVAWRGRFGWVNTYYLD